VSTEGTVTELQNNPTESLGEVLPACKVDSYSKVLFQFVCISSLCFIFSKGLFLSDDSPEDVTEAIDDEDLDPDYANKSESGDEDSDEYSAGHAGDEEEEPGKGGRGIDEPMDEEIYTLHRDEHSNRGRHLFTFCRPV
jgi:hypothetical protein